MADDNKKKRHPKSEREPEYPYNQVTQTLGGHEIHWDSTPGKENHVTFHPGGTYTEVNKDGRKVTLVSGEKYHTTSQGATNTVEGAHDHLVGTGSRRTDWGGTHHEVAEDHTLGVHGQYAKAVKGSIFHYTTGEMHHVSEGPKFSDHNDGEIGTHSSNDDISTVGGQYYRMSKGEWGSYSQGNMDIKTDKKARFASEKSMLIKTKDTLDGYSEKAMTLKSKDTWDSYSEKAMTITSKDKISANAQSDISIKSQSKITLEVGGSSITIESGKITIKSAQIEFQQG